MNSTTTEIQRSSSSIPLPGDDVLNSGAVIFPGAFDQQGCPLVVFPAEAQNKFTDISKEDISSFVNYFLRLHNESQEKESLISVVVDLRQGTVLTTSCFADILQQLELHKRTIHTVYIVQPKKKDVLKLLLKVFVPGNSKHYIAAPFKRIFLKEVCELYNYIDRSQLSPSLGGYLIYSHTSWVSFVKEIDIFVKQFLSVVQRLPSCIATLQSISHQPIPSGLDELTEFCSVNEARFQQLRRDLGLDELLRHCECVVEKLRYPEIDPCYQAMAGTAIFNHTAYDMLLNYSRITAAVEKVELLWQQAFSKAHFQLQVLRLQREAQQITEQMGTLREEKLQPYRIEIAKDATRANLLKLDFESSIYTPAMTFVRRAEDLIHTLREMSPHGEQMPKEPWVEELDILKEQFYSIVQLPYQTLRVVSDFYHYFDKVKSWYSLVLCESFLQDLLWGGNCEGFSAPHAAHEPLCGVPVWRQAVENFLRRNPSPEMAELVQLAHLANVIPETTLQLSGKQLSHRCTILRKLLTSPGAVPLNDLQLALQWQYEFLKGSKQAIPMPEQYASKALASNVKHTTLERATALPPQTAFKPGLHETHPVGNLNDQKKWRPGREVANPQPGLLSPNTCTTHGQASGKPASLSSFDSGFDGAGSSHLENGNGRELLEAVLRVPGASELALSKPPQPQINEENIYSISDSEEHQQVKFCALGNQSSASIQIIPKVTVDSLNFEIKVKRSASQPKNPWLSLPVEDLENSYTVTITPTKNTRLEDMRTSSGSERSLHSDVSSRSRDQPTQTETFTSRSSSNPEFRASSSQDSFELSDLSPVRGVLSSTVTEPRDQPLCETEGIPTLVWDSYDFHNLRSENCDGLSTSLSEMSLSDWALKEQEGLKEVEEILDRAAVILEEEENILEQEEVLDVLVKTEATNEHSTPSWPDEQFTVMSSEVLKESGVIGVESQLTALSSEQENCMSTQDSENDHGLAALSSEYSPSMSSSDLEVVQSKQGSLLQELHDLRDLDERILEESVKIQELRQGRFEELRIEEPQDIDPAYKCRTDTRRARFLKELEKEKREVERMERSLHKEMEKDKRKVKKRLSRSRRVLTLSISEKTPNLENMLDEAVCDPNPNSPDQNSKKLMGADNVVDSFTSNDSLKLAQQLPQSNCVIDPLDTSHKKVGQANVSTASEDDHAISSNGFCHTVKSATNSTDLLVSSAIITKGSEVEITVAEAVAVDNDNVHELKGGHEMALALYTPLNINAFDPGGPAEMAPVAKPRKSLTSDDTRIATKSDVHTNRDVTFDSPFSEPVVVVEPPQPKARTCKRSSNDLIHPDVMIHTSNNNNNNPTIKNETVLATPDTEGQFREPEVEQMLGEKGNEPEQLLYLKMGPLIDQMFECEDRDEEEDLNSRSFDQVLLLKDYKTEQHKDEADSPDTTTTFDQTLDPQSHKMESRDDGVTHLSDQSLEPQTHISEPAMDEQEDNPLMGEMVALQNHVAEHPDDVHPESETCSGMKHAVVEEPVSPMALTASGEGGDDLSGFQINTLSTCPISSTPDSQLIDMGIREMSNFKTPIVLDTGSGLMKAGFADQDLPTTVFPTVIGIPKYEEVMNGSFERETYIGHDAQHMRGVLALKYPMKNGIIQNWDDMEMIWNHTFQQLNVEAEDHPVLLTEAALNPKENRQHMVELMFEAFSVPLTYVAMQAVLALYAAGRTTGVVFDSGDGVSHSVPVFEGYCLPHAVQRFNLAGLDVTLHLKKLLQEQGVSMCTSAEQEIVRDMKEAHCYVALDYEAELAYSGGSSTPVHYSLPDGHVITLTSERFRATEILFKPELIGRDHYGLHESVLKSILHSDIDLRRSFVGNIVLSGGNTLLQGLPGRLQNELKKMVPADLAEAVRVASPKDRDFSVWSGGAVLANLPAFSSAWISQEEYEEFGPQIVFRKCF